MLLVALARFPLSTGGRWTTDACVCAYT